jgi:hypothetical protein
MIHDPSIAPAPSATACHGMSADLPGSSIIVPACSQ